MDKEQCQKLIQLYSSHRALWDPGNNTCFTKKLRETAWECISEEMGLPVVVIRQKMDSLLGSYRREKSRERKSRVEGSGSRVYNSNWFAYKFFHFMSDKNDPSNAQDTKATNEPKSNEHECSPLIKIECNELAETGTTSSGNNEEQNKNETEIERESRKRNIEDETEENEGDQKRKLQKMTHGFETQENDIKSEACDPFQQCTHFSSDPYFTYGQYIANELRKYDATTSAYVKHAINNIIFEADTGKYQYFNKM